VLAFFLIPYQQPFLIGSSLELLIFVRSLDGNAGFLYRNKQS
jgi:hypothetical protein